MVRPLERLLILVLFFSACQSPEPQKGGDGTVRVHKTSEPAGLNPITSTGSEALEIQNCLFQKLLDHHLYTEELVPVLAEEVPEPEILNDSTIRLTYRIREEARWDNGDPIRAEDVAFTIKAALSPGIDAQAKKGYLSIIRAIERSEDDPKKIAFVCDRYIRALYSTGAELAILPAHVYDPEGAISSLKLRTIREDPDSIKKREGYKEMRDRLNAKGIAPEDHPKGSGPYRLQKWVAKEKLVLERKKDHWTQKLDTTPNPYFTAHPKRILHLIIPDKTSALKALKKEKLDVIDHLSADRFGSLKNSKSIEEHFHYKVAPQLGYSYLTLRMDDPILQDRSVRKALACLVPKERIRSDLTGGHGKFLVGPVHPSKERYYHDALTPYRFDLEKAQKLLDRAGWKDRNGDGIREGRINGEPKKLSLSFLYNAGSETRKKVGVLLKENSKKAGIRIKLEPAEWSIYSQMLEKGNFQVAIGGFAFSNAPQDPRQLFHSSASDGGSNYAGFGSARTDSLIDSLRVTLDPEERKSYWYALQEAIHQEVPMIFLQTAVNRLAINKRFGEVKSSRILPGFWAPGLRDTSWAEP